MKRLLFLIPLVFLSTPANAITWNEFWRPFTHNGHNNHYHHRPRYCDKVVYREQYVPRTHWRPGYVKRWTETIKVPCDSHHNYYNHH